MRFLDVKTDYAFKKVFGSEQSKAILIDFLNALINFPDTSITDLVIVDPYQIPLIKGMKDSYVDVKAVLANNTHVIIEMQLLNYEGFEKRVLYNAAKLYSSQLMRAEDYETLEPIIALTITDFPMFKDLPQIITYWHVREKETLLKYNDDIELIFVELPKFNKREDELVTVTDKWLYFLRNAESLEFIPQTITEPPLLNAFDIANTAGMDADELELQFKRKDFIYMQRKSLEKAQKEGLMQGREETLRQMIQNMLALNLPMETIGIVTGLSFEEIQDLQ